MAWHRIALWTFATLALALPVGQTPAGEPKKDAEEKRPSAAELEALMTRAGLDAAQKAKVLGIREATDKKINARIGIWTALHDVDFMLRDRLTDQQRARQQDVLMEMRARVVPTLAAKLGIVGDGPKLRIAKLRSDYQPKFLKLITPTQSGDKITKEEREATHKLVVAIRQEFLDAVRSALTEDQRTRLPAALREYPGIPSLVPDTDSLAFLLLGASLGHFSQPETLESLASRLELTAKQKDEFQKAGVELAPNLKKIFAKYNADYAEYLDAERQAIAKVLTDEQRAKWSSQAAPSAGAKNRDPFEQLLASLGLDESQKAQLRKIHLEFAKKTTPATTQLWNEYHDQLAIQMKLLTDKQQAALPGVLKAMRAAELDAFKTKLGLSEEQKQRIAKLVSDYEPRYYKLIAPTLEGDKITKEEWVANHHKIAEMRLDLLEAVGAELTEAQRAKLPAVLRQKPGLPTYIREDASLSFVLLAATLTHYCHPDSLDALATRLELSAPQKEQLRKSFAEQNPKLQKRGAQLLDVLREEREAMAPVLTDAQRTRWSELRKIAGEEK